MKIRDWNLVSAKTSTLFCYFLFTYSPNGLAQQLTQESIPNEEISSSITAPVLASRKSNDSSTLTPKNTAIAAAIADGLTTSLALSSGAIEYNSAIPTSPLGLVALTGLKIGLIKYSESFTEPEKRLTLKSTAAIWGGAAVNNIAVYLAAPPPVPIIAGLLMGITTWINMSNNYKEADTLLAESQITKLKPIKDR
jgi:hypothetical protein